MGKTKISIVGPGSLGSALAVALHTRGYRIAEIVYRPTAAAKRKAQALALRVDSVACSFSNAKLTAAVLWLCVPDRSIAAVAHELALKKKSWRGTTVLHSSGALPSDELNPLRKRGAVVASLHPLMTFVPGIDQSFAGVPFAVEGEAAAVRRARQLVRGLEGTISLLQKSKKAAYHAWGAFTSPLLLSLLVTSEQVAKLAGISPKEARKRMLPIVLQTIENYINQGPARAFSGPILRGDLSTLERHLKALNRRPAAQKVYRALAQAALQSLPAAQKKAQQLLLRKKSSNNI